MEKEFIPYDQALALKELGFNEGCLTYYFIGGKMSNYFKKVHKNSGLIQQKPYKFHCTVPTFSQSFKWFRKKHDIFSSIWYFETERKFFIDWGFGIQKFEVVYQENLELECLKKLIEIVKNKK
jgi:hypothetical protein